MWANQRRKLARSSDECNSAASGMPSLSESPQNAPGEEVVDEMGAATEEASLAGFCRDVPACGDFLQPSPGKAKRPASANNAQACLIRIMRLFRAQFIVDDRSLR